MEIAFLVSIILNLILGLFCYRLCRALLSYRDAMEDATAQLKKLAADWRDVSVSAKAKRCLRETT